MKITLIILGYLFIGVIVVSAFEKIKLTILKWDYSIEPFLLEKYPPNPAWHTNTPCVWVTVIL